MIPQIDRARLESVLIVKLSSIGDVVHALPVANALRRRYPGIRISWAVEDWVAPLIAGHRAIDRLVVFPRMEWRRNGPAWLRSLRGAIAELRRESYDVSLDLQGLLKSALVVSLARAELRAGSRYQREGAGLVSRIVPDGRGRLPVVEEYLQCAELLGAAAAPVEFHLPVATAAASAVARLLHAQGLSPQSRPIVINPSPSMPWKTWGVERWARLARALVDDGPVVLMGSREHAARHAEVAARASRPLVDLTGRTTLAEMVALLDRCALHIAPDTASAHVAAALGRPVVSLFGPTPTWRQAPYGQNGSVVYREGCCGVGCPRMCLRNRRCLEAVTPDEVLSVARDRLARRRLCADVTVGARDR